MWKHDKISFVSVIPYVFKQIHCELKHPLISSYILTLSLFITSRSYMYPDEWPTLIGQITIQKIVERILISPNGLLRRKNIARFSRKF